ncbi:uncharacterized protein LODBEIA_P48510 [Lodderomyces beijingensis]|uniref:Uncharacterized protein n=1 Tax=Lodderomyces beijingensis TaxID=1775926 RepID=A0ABP0ZTD3_9ASCO
MSINQVVNSVRTDGATEANLTQLRVLLRDEQVRSSQELKSNLAFLMEIFIQVFKSAIDQYNSTDASRLFSIAIEAIKVAINLVASNADNCDFFTKDADLTAAFWNCIHEIYTLNEAASLELVFTLISQFLYVEGDVAHYVRYLHSQSMNAVVYTEFASSGDPEVAREFITANKHHFDSADKKFLEHYANRFHEIYANVSDSDKETAIEILEFVSPSSRAFKSVLSLLESEKDTKLLRKLMVASTDVFPGDIQDLAKEEEFLVSPQSSLVSSGSATRKNSYAFAACCICVGNTISSDETRIKTIQLINDSFGIKNLLFTFFSEFKITDIVQLQAIHMWNNLLDQSIASSIIDHYREELTTLTKLMIDNANYYKEISVVYFKFINKLIKFSTGTHVLPAPLARLVSDFNDNSNAQLTYAKYSLLQQHAKNLNDNLSESAVTKLVKFTVSSVNRQDILEQLKTVAILNTQLSEKKISIRDLDTVYLGPLAKLLDQLYTQLPCAREDESWKTKIFDNNLKFVAGSTIKLLDGSIDFASLKRLCDKILQN